MRALLRAIHRIVRHPLTTTVAGVVFLLAGMAEIFEASLGLVGETGLEAQHAIVVLGVITLLKGLGEMFEAEEVLDRAAAERAVTRELAEKQGSHGSPPRA